MGLFSFSLALGPLAVYLLLLGSVNLSRRPFLTTGTCDLLALGVGVSGLMIVGPFNLFMPDTAMIRFGSFAWLPLILLYILCLTLIIRVIRLRLVIYNISGKQLRPVLDAVISRLGYECVWAGDILLIPQLGIQLEIDCFTTMRNSTLRATSARQNYLGWRRLKTELAVELGNIEVEPNRYGRLMVLLGLLGLVVGGACIVWQRTSIL